MALSHFKQAHANFRGRIIYHFASVEEGPYGLGTTHFLKDSLTDKPDFAILTEPAGQVGETTHPAIALGSKGGYNYTVHLKGKSAHAATPALGISAAEDAARLIPSPKSDRDVGSSGPGKGRQLRHFRPCRQRCRQCAR